MHSVVWGTQQTVWGVDFNSRSQSNPASVQQQDWSMEAPPHNCQVLKDLQLTVMIPGHGWLYCSVFWFPVHLSLPGVPRLPHWAPVCPPECPLGPCPGAPCSLESFLSVLFWLGSKKKRRSLLSVGLSISTKSAFRSSLNWVLKHNTNFSWGRYHSTHLEVWYSPCHDYTTHNY